MRRLLKKEGCWSRHHSVALFVDSDLFEYVLRLLSDAGSHWKSLGMSTLQGFDIAIFFQQLLTIARAMMTYDL